MHKENHYTKLLVTLLQRDLLEKVSTVVQPRLIREAWTCVTEAKHAKPALAHNHISPLVFISAEGFCP